MTEEENELQKGSSYPPLYKQLKSLIKEEISQGALEAGEQIPTEQKLCNRFSISRTPVRQAIKELVNEGVLTRKQGSGTFVSNDNKGKITLKVVITEKRWTRPLKKAVQEVAGNQSLNLNLEVLGRPHFRERMLSYIGKGEAPDIALIDSAWVTEFAAYRFIEPLNQLDPEWTNHIKSQLLTPFISRNKYQNNLYALQPEGNVSLLWYRKDEFDRLNLTPPQNWLQLTTTAKKLKDAGWDYPIGFAGGTSAGETTTYQLLPFIWSAGGKVFQDGEVRLMDGGVKAIQYLSQLVRRYEVVSPQAWEFSWDQPSQLFAKGEIAMAFGGSYELKRLQNYSNWGREEFWQKVGWTPLPGPTKRKKAATAGGMVYVILRQADHPDLALEVLKEVMKPDSISRFCERTSRIPTTKDSISDLSSTETTFLSDVMDLLEHAQAPPSLPQYPEVSEQLQLMLERVLQGRMKPAHSVEKSSEVIRALS